MEAPFWRGGGGGDETFVDAVCLCDGRSTGVGVLVVVVVLFSVAVLGMLARGDAVCAVLRSSTPNSCCRRMATELVRDVRGMSNEEVTVASVSTIITEETLSDSSDTVPSASGRVDIASRVPVPAGNGGGARGMLTRSPGAYDATRYTDRPSSVFLFFPFLECSSSCVVRPRVQSIGRRVGGGRRVEGADRERVSSQEELQEASMKPRGVIHAQASSPLRERRSTRTTSVEEQAGR